METGTVANIRVSEHHVWQDFFEAQIIFDNNDSGKALVKTRDRFKVGDKLTYTKKETEYGLKFKGVTFADKPAFGGGGFKKQPANEKAKVPSIAVSYALRYVETLKGESVTCNEMLMIAKKIQDHILTEMESVG